jgi:hypothetical protein
MGLNQAAQAKLGETVEQIEARYGKALKMKTDAGLEAREYKFDEKQVQVSFLGGRSVKELIMPVAVKQFSDEECLALAKALSGEEKWSGPSRELRSTTWHSGTNFLAMRIHPAAGADGFVITSAAFAEKIKSNTTGTARDLADKFGSKPAPRP